MAQQRSICSAISARGVGIHSGETVLMKLSPANIDTGVVFRRVDLPSKPEILARASNVGETTLSTCLVKDGVRVATIEHLMAAIASLGIDNIIIDLTAAEVPIMDGSSAPFIFLLQSAGIVEQESYKKIIVVKKTVAVTGKDGAFCSFKPSKTPVYNLSMDFAHPHGAFCQQNQKMCFNFSTNAFQNDLSRARTFGFLREYEMLRKNNLALGGGLNNAIVFNDFEVMNKDPLRFEDEPIRHKMLDAVGDLYLAGHAILAEFTGYKSGHMLNNKIVLALLAQQDCWDKVCYSSVKKCAFPISYASPIMAV